MLAWLGAILGIVFAYAGDLLLIDLLSSKCGLPLLLDVRPDPRVLLFTAGVALITGVVFGLVPASRVTALGYSASLNPARVHGRTFGWLGSVLVISQVAFSVLFVSGRRAFRKNT
ncbi:MAG TPA: hypothetical protein VFA65_05310 [Bryobacteraceae bacterium]|nr:hypothetical protein [Bryobacteraceae bacterium]